MRRDDVFAIPRPGRWLIEAAAVLAPGECRIAWKREWLWETWHGYDGLRRDGVSSARAARRVTRFASGALVDAADLRWDYLRTGCNARAVAREPFFCLALLLLAFFTLAAGTGGFRHTRAAIAPLYPESEQLVLLSRPAGVLGFQTATRMDQLWSWIEYSQWFGSVAGFVFHGRTLEVSPNFFAVLHTNPVGSSARWRFLGQPVQSIRYLGPGYSAAQFGGAIARLKVAANREELEAQLAKLGGDGDLRVTATFLDERGRWPLYFAGAASLLFLTAGMLRLRRTVGYLAFFAVKAALVLAMASLAWIEVATAIPIPVTGGVDLGTAIPLVGLLLFTQVFLMRWSLEDQAGRCPVCCRQVAMPITVGSRSSLILDRPGVDFLCTRGHGTLHLSDLTACTGEPYRWTPLDRSWREVFARERSA